MNRSNLEFDLFVLFTLHIAYPAATIQAAIAVRAVGSPMSPCACEPGFSASRHHLRCDGLNLSHPMPPTTPTPDNTLPPL